MSRVRRTCCARKAGRRLRWTAALTALAVLDGAGAFGQATAPAPIRVELNKLEPLPAQAAAPGSATPGSATSAPGCRVYIVVANPDPDPLTQLRLDLILFGGDGVIARRVALDLGPLPPHKTAVRLFDLQGQPCDGIGRVLVNDVLGCQSGDKQDAAPITEGRTACLDRLQLSSRATPELTK